MDADSTWLRRLHVIVPAHVAPTMRSFLMATLAALALPFHQENAMAETIHFDDEPVGALAQRWICGVTGAGSARWTIAKDISSTPPRNVLRQDGRGDFPWCVVRNAVLSDGFVEVRFKPIAGNEDRAGGVVWRFKDGDNYYVARANALESNVSLYYTQRGRRNTIRYVDAPVASDTWHTLRVEFSARHIRVTLDGKAYIEADDDRIGGGGAVGVWTKADSVTLFDDFTYAAAPAK